MNAVLISIHPKWCDLIADGKKTVEVRKTRPKLETPFKVYIYCTKEKRKSDFITKSEKFGYLTGHEGSFYNRAKEYDANGKVIGEFVCKRIVFLDAYYDTNGNRHLCNTAFIWNSCITDDKLFDYLYGKHGRKHGGWAWCISDLVIYDKPKGLSEFTGLRKTKFGYEPIKITRPPQSWCYVTEDRK